MGGLETGGACVLFVLVLTRYNREEGFVNRCWIIVWKLASGLNGGSVAPELSRIYRGNMCQLRSYTEGGGGSNFPCFEEN